MRINFIGCPCSGKTTTAAMTFAKLKELGFNCEFITEQARMHIATKRWMGNMKPEEALPLTDTDQFHIMVRQINTEKVFGPEVVGDAVIVICDSSALNSLLYMSEKERDSTKNAGLIQQAIEQSDLVFYCPPVAETPGLDPNRVHSREQSLAIDSQIPEVMSKYAPEVWNKIIRLSGDAQIRMRAVVNAILSA